MSLEPNRTLLLRILQEIVNENIQLSQFGEPMTLQCLQQAIRTDTCSDFSSNYVYKDQTAFLAAKYFGDTPMYLYIKRTYGNFNKLR